MGTLSSGGSPLARRRAKVRGSASHCGSSTLLLVVPPNPWHPLPHSLAPPRPGARGSCSYASHSCTGTPCPRARTATYVLTASVVFLKTLGCPLVSPRPPLLRQPQEDTRHWPACPRERSLLPQLSLPAPERGGKTAPGKGGVGRASASHAGRGGDWSPPALPAPGFSIQDPRSGRT